MNGWVGGRSKEFWVLSLPVLPGYRSGALANLREEAPSHTASLGRVAPPSPSGSHNLRCMIIYSTSLRYYYFTLMLILSKIVTLSYTTAKSCACQMRIVHETWFGKI
eukprot:COSAG06_NODE_30218_length_542_cov_3.191874_1_plen_106_part_10